MHILVTGWFSFPNMGNSVGDMIAKDIVCNWLQECEISFDVALTEEFKNSESVNWEKVDPNNYSDIIFVCGPFGNGWPVTDLLERFSNCRLIGINLSLLQTLDEWNPFTLLYERDSSAASHPDITFYAPPPKVPVVGVILVHKQKEYGNRARHEEVHAAIEHFIHSREMCVVRIDTALESNRSGLRSSGEVEALIARMDVVVTTRLHGTVLALKNGVPVIPVDPIAYGAKITKQVNAIGWPVLFNSDNLNDDTFRRALDYCLTEHAKLEAKACSQKARNHLSKIKDKFISEVSALPKV